MPSARDGARISQSFESRIAKDVVGSSDLAGLLEKALVSSRSALIDLAADGLPMYQRGRFGRCSHRYRRIEKWATSSSAGNHTPSLEMQPPVAF